MRDELKACFEAGIKLGALYHQFTGMPVRTEFIRETEKIIEESVKSQPHVIHAEVMIDEERLRKDYSRMGYAELRGEHLKVEITVRVGKATASARLEYDENLRYPLMKLTEVMERPEDE